MSALKPGTVLYKKLELGGFSIAVIEKPSCDEEIYEATILLFSPSSKLFNVNLSLWFNPTSEMDITPKEFPNATTDNGVAQADSSEAGSKAT